MSDPDRSMDKLQGKELAQDQATSLGSSDTGPVASARSRVFSSEPKNRSARGSRAKAPDKDGDGAEGASSGAKVGFQKRKVFVIPIGDHFQERYFVPTISPQHHSPITYPDKLRGSAAVRMRESASGIQLHAKVIDDVLRGDLKQPLAKMASQREIATYLRMAGSSPTNGEGFTLSHILDYQTLVHSGTFSSAKAESASGEQTSQQGATSSFSELSEDEASAFNGYLHELAAFPRHQTDLGQRTTWRIRETRGLVEDGDDLEREIRSYICMRILDNQIEMARCSIQSEVKDIPDQSGEVKPEIPLFIVVVNDRNLGFRQRIDKLRGLLDILKEAMVKGCQVIVLWHLRRPQLSSICAKKPRCLAGLLCDDKYKDIRSSTVVIVNEQCLRDEGVNLRFDASYEHTCQDFLRFSSQDRIKSLVQFPQLVIRFDYGALHVSLGESRSGTPRAEVRRDIKAIDAHGMLGGPFYLSYKTFGIAPGRTFLLVLSMVREIVKGWGMHSFSSVEDLFLEESVSPFEYYRSTLINRAIDLGILLNAKHFYNGFGKVSDGLPMKILERDSLSDLIVAIVEAERSQVSFDSPNSPSRENSSFAREIKQSKLWRHALAINVEFLKKSGAQQVSENAKTFVISKKEAIVGLARKASELLSSSGAGRVEMIASLANEMKTLMDEFDRNKPEDQGTLQASEDVAQDERFIMALEEIQALPVFRNISALPESRMPSQVNEDRFPLWYQHGDEPALTRLVRFHYPVGSPDGGGRAEDRYSRISMLKCQVLLSAINTDTAAIARTATDRNLSERHVYEEVLIQIVTDGVESVTQRRAISRMYPEPSVLIPFVSFRDQLVALDRDEIDSFLSIRFLLDNYLRGVTQPRAKPLSIAVFGHPGSGKSFTVKAILGSTGRKESADFITFNMSQMRDADDLAIAFHRIRDLSSAGRIPVAFFDEFDSTKHDEGAMGWLKYFLAPMQDGEYSDRNNVYHIGPAIFVFAGGTLCDFGEFQSRSKDDAGKKAKVPDFISRLRGYLDISDITDRSSVLEDAERSELRADHYNSTQSPDAVKARRALLLRSLLKAYAPGIFDGTGRVADIETDIVRAFLNADRYEHGARSMQAIIEMSRLSESQSFRRSALPPKNQLDMHVNGGQFLDMANGVVANE